MAIDAQTIATLAAGIGGTLGTIKLIRFVASRRAGPDGPEEEASPREHETAREYKDRLFPNGERDQIIMAINALKAENIARAKENANLNAMLRDISARLERHGI